MTTKFDIWLNLLKKINKTYPFGPLKIKYNEDGKIHADNEPAYVSPTRVMWFTNGKKHGLDVDIFGSISYHYENILVPKHFITNPEKLTFEEVVNNPNAEVRYVGMKLIGYDNIKHKAKIIDKDGEKELLQFNGILTDPIMLVKVLNSTMTNGEYKAYYLSVPPTMKTCKEAVAWTFRKEAKDYHPKFET